MVHYTYYLIFSAKVQARILSLSMQLFVTVMIRDALEISVL